MAWARRGAAGDRPHELVRFVTRLAVAQVVTAAAVGLPFSRRHVQSVLITLGFVAVLGALAVVLRVPARQAWLTALVLESAFFLYGLDKFVVSRYVGGTLFALIIAGTLVHPAVARAYNVRWGRWAGAAPTDDALAEGLGDAAETLGGHTAG